MQLDAEDLDAWCKGYWRRYREMAEPRAEMARRAQASVGDADGEQVWARVRERVQELARQAALPSVARR